MWTRNFLARATNEIDFINATQTVAKLVRGNNIQTEAITRATSPGHIYRRLLVGTDCSACSTAAFEEGLKLARQNGAELLIAHVFSMPDCINFLPSDNYDDWKTNCLMEARRNLGPLVEKARRNHVKAHLLMLEGTADDAIVDAAKRPGVDLIVIGGHGDRRILRFILGSVVASVISRAPCAGLNGAFVHQGILNWNSI